MKDNYQNDDFLRKRNERQKKIKKRRAKIAVSVILILLICVGVVLSVTVLFPIKNIEVKGSKIYSSAQLKLVCEELKGKNLIITSEQDTLQMLRSKLPYVYTVEFERSLPDTLNIKVTDAKEYACYRVSNRYYTVSNDGWVLNSYAEPPKDIILIICDKVKCKIGTKIEFTDNELDLESIKTQIIESLSKNNISVNYLQIKGEGFVEAKVEGRFIVDFGQMADIDSKIKHLSTMMEEIDKNATGRINLSMWNGQNKQGSFVQSDIK